MAISHRASTGISARTTAASHAWTLPTGHATDDLLIAWLGGKPYNNTYTALGDSYVITAVGANGTNATTANGAGSVQVAAWYKTHDGSESAPSTTLGSTPNPMIQAMSAYTKTNAQWAIQSSAGSDATSTGTTFSAASDTTLELAAGDTLVVLMVHNDDSSSSSAWAVSASGITFGTVNQRLTGTLTTASGGDGRMYVIDAPVSTGSGTVTITVTATTGTGDSDGEALFLVLREQAQAETGTVTGVAPATSGTITSADKGGKGTVTGVAPATSGALTSPDKGGKGSVTGLAPATSGTITDTTQRFGTVTGSATASGTVTGTKQEANNDKTGTVTGSASATGTVAGTKKSTGTVVGAATASGTVTGSEGSGFAVAGQATASGTVTGTKKATGAPTGTATASGTVAGTKATTGTVTGSATATGTVTGTAAEPDRDGTVTGTVTATGTVTGTKYDPDAPVPVEPEATGGGKGYPAPRQQLPKPIIVRKSGTVSGAAIVRGIAHGRKTSATGRARASVPQVRATTYGRCDRTSATTRQRIETRGHAYGDAVYPMSATHIRRLLDDAELLLLTKETP